MTGGSFLYQMVLFLAAAVIIVPLSKRLGFGTVLGFLAAGAVLGPWGLGLVSRPDDVLHFAEFGVVLLLFLIGLELHPARLRELRRPIFGMGSAQVAATGLLIMLAGLALGLAPATALVVGLVLSLSSTAFALQILGEKGQLASRHGRDSFAVLLFQDLAAIPMLAIIPLLGLGGADLDGETGLFAVARAIAVIAAVIVGGRWLLRPFFRLAASSRTQEIFTAAALLVVIGTALLVQQAGLSMALGAFLAGVLLGETEYRHELEADIEPFKGLLLGLFFMAVGMSIDLALVLRDPLVVLGLVLGLLAVKGVALYSLGRIAGRSHRTAANTALFISQGGEFAFVLFGAAAGAQVIAAPLADLLVLVVAMSMAATPLLLLLNERVLRIGGTGEESREFDTIPPHENMVIIAGFGRFGQVVARTLRMRRIPFTALEASFEQVDFVRKYGNKIYFGDASRLELLRAARADQARVFVLAIDDVDASIKTARMVRQHYPHLKIFARARNRFHTYKLMDIGVDRIIRETLLSSIDLAKDVLMELGVPDAEAAAAARTFREHDEALIRRQHAVHHDEEQLIASTRQAADELQRLFEQDTRG